VIARRKGVFSKNELERPASPIKRKRLGALWRPHHRRRILPPLDGARARSSRPISGLARQSARIMNTLCIRPDNCITASIIDWVSSREHLKTASSEHFLFLEEIYKSGNESNYNTSERSLKIILFRIQIIQQICLSK